MTKLAAPFVSRSTGGRLSASVFNEGISIPKDELAKAEKRNPALASKNAAERGEAFKKEILKGDLAQFRRR